jgi:actin-related protein
VLEHGSGICKVGFAGDEDPRSFFPSIIGVPKCVHRIRCNHINDTCIGHEACARVYHFILKYPVEHGLVMRSAVQRNMRLNIGA